MCQIVFQQPMILRETSCDERFKRKWKRSAVEAGIEYDTVNLLSADTKFGAIKRRDISERGMSSAIALMVLKLVTTK